LHKQNNLYQTEQVKVMGEPLLHRQGDSRVLRQASVNGTHGIN